MKVADRLEPAQVGQVTVDGHRGCRAVRVDPMTSGRSDGAPGSRLLRHIDQVTSRPLVALALLTADGLWVGFSISVGFPTRIETVFQTLVAALTLALVFVIQHTQAREQLVTQRKLDEILHALPAADNSVIGLEDASNTELAALHSDHRQLRDQAIQTP
jgi:low affinity Fe/Cu permease